LRAALAEMPDSDLGYGDPCGLTELRSEIAAYLRRVRAVDADARRTLITSGTVQAIDLACRALRSRGACRVAVEDPGWAAQAATVQRAGLEPVPVPVDDAGIDVDHLDGLDVDAALVTPAHQFPTGAVLSPPRRHRLVEWAAQRNALIVEDDYDAEYRYDRNATGSLQGLAPDHVAYAGSASKTLAPALRLGWLVLPPSLVNATTAEKRDADRMTSPLTQLAFARFLARGDLDRHLRQTRLLYRDRRAALLEALAHHVPDAELSGAAAGLHAVMLLHPTADEPRIVSDARSAGIALTGLADLHLTARPHRPGLVLGYAQLSPDRIATGIAALAKVVANAQAAPPLSHP
ncbi:MAG TPA: PLP-dependent aminotransferase family protein, partial [Thermoleophilaceae bacterium]|nr:PLP-dependent aminotransferase family protein [Thermoleophilaceae bacterium]